MTAYNIAGQNYVRLRDIGQQDSMTICGMTMVSTSMTRGCCVSAGPEIYGPL